MRSKKEIKELEEEVRKIFLSSNIKPPSRILPNIIFDHMTPTDCFKTRVRTLMSKASMDRNFKVDNEGIIITNFRGEPPILLMDHKSKIIFDNKKEEVKKINGIDINKL